MRVLLYVLFLLLTSCGLSEVGVVNQQTGDKWRGEISTNVSRTIVYTTAVTYPEGYDWLKDAERASVKAYIQVFEDGVPRNRVKISDFNHVSSDPDMHRVIAGNLYTDFSTETETIIKKNGLELFRYQGRERIVHMFIQGADVYTLGEVREGGRIICRRNGEIVFEKKSAVLVREPYQDNGQWCYTYRLSSGTQRGGLTYLCVDSVEQLIEVPTGFVELWDVCRHDGELHQIVYGRNKSSPSVLSDGRYMELPSEVGRYYLDSFIFFHQDELYVESVCSSSSRFFITIWSEKNGELKFDADMDVSSVYNGEEDLYYVVNSSADGTPGFVMRNEESFELPPDYYCIKNDVVLLENGVFYVGLSSRKMQKPLLWKDGNLDTLDINGYITSISSHTFTKPND